MPWTYVISDLKGKEMVGIPYEKKLQNNNNNNNNKNNKEKRYNSLLKGKATMVLLTMGLITKT